MRLNQVKPGTTRHHINQPAWGPSGTAAAVAVALAVAGKRTAVVTGDDDKGNGRSTVLLRPGVGQWYMDA